jgi:hypothetical protein
VSARLCSRTAGACLCCQSCRSSSHARSRQRLPEQKQQQGSGSSTVCIESAVSRVQRWQQRTGASGSRRILRYRHDSEALSRRPVTQLAFSNFPNGDCFVHNVVWRMTPQSMSYLLRRQRPHWHAGLHWRSARGCPQQCVGCTSPADRCWSMHWTPSAWCAALCETSESGVKLSVAGRAVAAVVLLHVLSSTGVSMQVSANTPAIQTHMWAGCSACCMCSWER